MWMRTMLALLILTGLCYAQEPVTLQTEDGGVLRAIVYGKGDHGVVLAHGGRFNKESWAKQAHALADAGFRSIAFDFRGYGESRGPGQADLYTAPLYWDVLAAARYLEKAGAKSVSIVGASFGGTASGDAVCHARAGEIDRIVLLAAAPDCPPEKLQVRKLFIVARDDANASGPRLPKIRAYYEKAPEPKKLIVIDGSAHAQFLFDTEQGDRLLHEIVQFLSAP
jgi:pimeloyl-ACP methyl ester carboxylesterase